VAFEQQVDVVAHLHVLVALDPVGGDALGEQSVVPLAVLEVLEHRPPVVSPAGDVVQSTFGQAAGSSWHAMLLSRALPHGSGVRTRDDSRALRFRSVAVRTEPRRPPTKQ